MSRIIHEANLWMISIEIPTGFALDISLVGPVMFSAAKGPSHPTANLPTRSSSRSFLDSKRGKQEFNEFQYVLADFPNRGNDHPDPGSATVFIFIALLNVDLRS